MMLLISVCHKLWSGAERVILFDVDIIVVKNKLTVVWNGLLGLLSPQLFDHYDDQHHCQ